MYEPFWDLRCAPPRASSSLALLPGASLPSPTLHFCLVACEDKSEAVTGCCLLLAAPLGVCLGPAGELLHGKASAHHMACSPSCLSLSVDACPQLLPALNSLSALNYACCRCSLPLAKEAKGGTFSWLGLKGSSPSSIQDCLTAFTADEKMEVRVVCVWSVWSRCTLVCCWPAQHTARLDCLGPAPATTLHPVPHLNLI
jgi:hypothetical protein